MAMCNQSFKNVRVVQRCIILAHVFVIETLKNWWTAIIEPLILKHTHIYIYIHVCTLVLYMYGLKESKKWACQRENLPCVAISIAARWRAGDLLILKWKLWQHCAILKCSSIRNPLSTLFKFCIETRLLILLEGLNMIFYLLIFKNIHSL